MKQTDSDLKQSKDKLIAELKAITKEIDRRAIVKFLKTSPKTYPYQ